MKKLYAFLLTTCFIIGFSDFSAAQSWKTQAQAGYVVSYMFDNGSGLTISLGETYKINSYIYIEGQASYAFFYITDSFLQGNKYKLHNINLLVGPRAYLIPKDYNTRFYLNFLVGINHYQEIYTYRLDITETGLGLSAGAFLEFKQKHSFGMSFETAGVLSLKYGIGF